MFIVQSQFMPTDMAEAMTKHLTSLWNPSDTGAFQKDKDPAQGWADYLYKARITPGVCIRLQIDNAHDPFHEPETMTLYCDETQFIVRVWSPTEYHVEIVTAPVPGWQEKERLIKEQWFEVFRRNCFLFGYDIPCTDEEQGWWELWYREESATREDKARAAPIQLSLWPEDPSQVAEARSPLSHQ